MSTLSIPRPHCHVNRRRQKFDRFANPGRAELPGVLAELSALASLVPENERLGYWHLRTRLIEKVIPQWERPSFLAQIEGDRA